MRKFGYITIILLILTPSASSEDKGNKYSSSAVYDRYGRNVGRVVERTNSAATYKEYYNSKGQKEFTQRTPNKYTPSHKIGVSRSGPILNSHTKHK